MIDRLRARFAGIGSFAWRRNVRARFAGIGSFAWRRNIPCTGALASMFVVGLLAVSASTATASVTSVLPGSCGSQTESQPFAPWNDTASYTPVAGGGFEAGAAGWTLAGGAAVAPGNETYNVAGGSQSLSLPARSSALSPMSCTSIYHPTVRFFLRNTGAPSSRLIVQAVYPGLLGGQQTATLGQLAGSSSWQPSPAMTLLVGNLLATVSLTQTTIAFRFLPADSTGAWSIDDVYIDPFMRG
jgi:hypothetical protein